MPDSTPSPDLALILVDWGTSSLRVWGLAADGTVIARTASDDGMNRLAAPDFEPALMRLIGPWLPDETIAPIPVTICGMAGARQGWREAPYRQVPCAPVAPGENLPVPTEDPRLMVSIVPGLSQGEPANVMRGEETQLAGLLRKLGPTNATICLPGTHSKWASLSGTMVTDFKTFMTGELFSLIATQSILRHSIGDESGPDRPAFLQGVGEMLADPAGLTGALFSIRAASLLHGTKPDSARAYLSGLLIGGELAATRSLWENRPVHLVGAPALTASYATALDSVGVAAKTEDAESLTLSGLRAATSTP